MEERLSPPRKEGMNRAALRLWGMILLALGLLSRGILQTRVLGLGSADGAQLLQVLDLAGGMAAASVAIALQAVEGCAVPVFAFLLTEGFENTRSVKQYLLRVLGTAVLSEIPFNFVMSGRLLDVSSRNPVFGLVLALIMLYFFRRYPGENLKNGLTDGLVLIAAVLWALMFRVQYGAGTVVIAATLWGFRSRPALRLFLAAAAALVCCIGSPLFIFAPMGFLLVHFYNGEEGTSPRLLQYLLYPILLILIGAVGVLLFP